MWQKRRPRRKWRRMTRKKQKHLKKRSRQNESTDYTKEGTMRRAKAPAILPTDVRGAKEKDHPFSAW